MAYGAVFRKSCMACHRLEGEGNEIGPNLAAFANRGAESLLLNILDPNREIDPRYLTYQVVLHDGRLLVGMLESESAHAVTLRDAAGQVATHGRDEIERLRSTSVSLMPSNLEQDLSPAQMSDLIQYLLLQAQ